MKKMFDDTKFGRAAAAIIDIIWLGILWIICCIPAITFGASCSALYHTIVKSVRHERGNATKEFFRSFAQNFRFTWAVSLFLIIVAVTVAINTRFLVLYALPLLILLPWEFAYVSRFSETVINSLKNSLFLGIKNIGKTVLLDLILAVSVIICFLLPILIPIIPGFVCMAMSYITEPVFKEITIRMESDENEDKWYNE